MRNIILLSFLIFSLSAGFVSARDDIPDNCERPTEYQHLTWIPRYEYHNQRFILLDWGTGEIVMTLEENLLTEHFVFLRWSPNCRYISARVNENGDVYIWDTVTVSRVVVVPDSSGLTWSTDHAYILSLSEGNIVLWHLASNTSFVLVQSASSYESSSFSDTEVCFEDNNIERWRCFELSTGRELGASLPDAPIVTQSNFSFGNYDCVKISEGIYQLRNPETNTQIYLDNDDTRLVLREGLRFHNPRVINPIRQVINENFEQRVYQFRGWSSDCRFATAAIGAEWQNNTVVWDSHTWQVVGTWEDARNGVHGLSWSPVASDSVIIQTRNGTFFWQVLSNNRNLISDVELNQILWQSERGNFLAIPYGINAVKAFDIHTGQETSFYHIAERTAPVEYGIQGNWLYIYSTAEQGNRGAALWNLNTGQAIQLAHPIVHPQLRYSYRWWRQPQYWTWRINPSERYLVALLYEDNLAKVWDLANLREDGQANHIYAMSYIGERNMITWIDDTTLEFGTSLSRWNILDGEQIGESSIFVSENSSPVVVTLPHSNGSYGISNRWRDTDEYGTCPYDESGLFLQADLNGQVLRLRNLHTGETAHILEENFLGRIYEMSWSPDCRMVMAGIGNWYPAGTQGSSHTAVWNIETGQRVNLWDTSLYTVLWQANLQNALILPSRYNPQPILWHINTGESVQMENVGRMFYSRVYWDEGRNQIFANAYAGAFAFDAQTGQHLQTYTRPHDGGSNFIVSPDGNMMAVFTSADGQFDGLTVWNLNTLENWQLNLENTIPYGRDEIQFSPNGRFLAVRFNSIRVWDLQNLDVSLAERLPSQIIPIDDNASWQFESETILISQVGSEIQRWDVTTGQAIP